MISNPGLRPPLLNYLLRKLPKIADREDVAVVLGGKENVSLMVRAFSATLNDQQLLVQRGILELLVQNFVLKHRMIPYDDLVTLMKAALGIVLRKDMSLNRRLYAWLLGTEGSTQAQIIYFNTFAERAATQAMRSMLHQEQTSLQRPYKMLISLMDKPEVGQPIVNSIFMDSLFSLQKTQSNLEIMQSANMWMDMMEPYLICMKLFECLDTNFPSNKLPHALEKLKVVEFALTAFKLTDDEIQHVHFPLLLAVLSKKLQISLKSPSFTDILSHVDECILLILILLEQLPEHIFLKDHTPGKGKQYEIGMNIVDYVREYYGYQDVQQQTEVVTQNEEETKEIINDEGDLSSLSTKEPIQFQLQKRPKFEPLRGSVLVKEVADNMIKFLTEFVDKYIVLPKDLLDGIDVGAEGKRLKHIEHHLERVLLNTCKAINCMAKYADDTFEINQSLTKALLNCSQQVHAFGLVNAGLSTMVQLIKQRRFVDVSILKDVTHVKKIMDKLWLFLSPSTQMLHMRTVELIWLVVHVSVPHQVETIISNFLIHQDNTESYEKFGILWELSESIPEASLTFSRPMMIVLDLLGDHALKKRVGESWVRSYLNSYVRLLEPFILTLLDKKIIRRATTKRVEWKQQVLKNQQPKTTDIAYFLYVKPFDTEIVDYLLTLLTQLFQFGGQNALRDCKNHFIDPEGSIYNAVQVSLLDTDQNSDTLTFLDVLVLVCIRYLESESNNKHLLPSVIRSIQLHAIDFLYLIVSKLDHVDTQLIEKVQNSCLNKLLFCVTTENFDLQQKLLHLLHSTLAITSANAYHAKEHQRKLSSESELNKGDGETNEAILVAQSCSDLFVKTVIDALTLPKNRVMLTHWMDFLSAVLPYIKHGFQHMIVPILICICHQTYLRCGVLHVAIHEKPDDCLPLESAERETLIFLSGFERIAMFCLTEKHVSDDWFLNSTCEMPIPQLSENSGLSGFAQFVHENQKHEKPRDVILYQLPVIFHILLDVWKVFRKPEWTAETKKSLGNAKVEAILHTFSCAADQAKGRLETIFEKLFRYSTVDFVEAFTEIFFIENPLALELEQQQMDEKAFDYLPLDVLSVTPSSTPEHIVSILLDSIRQRTPGTYQNRRRNILRLGKLTDTSLLRFTEIYCGYMKKPESIVILWPIIHSFAKDYLSQASTFKAFLPGLMRFLTIALEELSLSEGYEKDRRIRRDAQELYQRCVDYCILIAGKALDQSLWMRRPTTVYDESVTDDGSSIHTADSVLFTEEKNLSTSNVSDMEKKASWKTREDGLINQINQYLANRVIPRLRKLVGDNDKINSLLNNLVYYVIVPSLKSKRSTVILNQLCEMAYMPFTYKTWRKEVWDMFIDNRFFYMTASAAKKWKTVIQTAFSIEKERFTELMNRTTISPSTTFFSNKDQEILNGALNLRRLSFVLFAGTVDQYVPQLPVIQEKIVELLKLEHGEMVHIEIYLCLRIMLVRFSQKHLMNFWPVLITELMRLFNSFVYNDFDYRPEEAQIALAGCKFLDLLCTLELDSFQIYQWIFIRDTVETLIKRPELGPTPIIELLNEKMMNLPNSMDISAISLMESTTPSSGSLRRPMLTMHSIGSIHQLSFFIEHVGLYVYQSSFTLAKPDLPFIESLLLNDMLEGDMDTSVTEN
ncbi:unnamed protein product [Rhizopus stolonifer]